MMILVAEDCLVENVLSMHSLNQGGHSPRPQPAALRGKALWLATGNLQQKDENDETWWTTTFISLKKVKSHDLTPNRLSKKSTKYKFLRSINWPQVVAWSVLKSLSYCVSRLVVLCSLTSWSVLNWTFLGNTPSILTQLWTCSKFYWYFVFSSIQLPVLLATSMNAAQWVPVTSVM